MGASIASRLAGWDTAPIYLSLTVERLRSSYGRATSFRSYLFTYYNSRVLYHIDSYQQYNIVWLAVFKVSVVSKWTKRFKRDGKALVTEAISLDSPFTKQICLAGHES